MSDQCDNCRFSANTNPEKENGNWICRRFPPINAHFVDDYGNDPATGGKLANVRACPVPVNHDWWCGEYKAKLNA